MASLHCSSSVSAPAFTFNSNFLVKLSFSSFSISFRNPKSYSTLTINCRAAKSVSNQKTSSSPSKPSKPSKTSKKKKKKKKNPAVEKDYEVLTEFPVEVEAQNFDSGLDLPLKYGDDDMLVPRPPTGFAVDDDGVVSITSTNRLVTIFDPERNLPLECLVRRVFKSSEREECMFVCPVDTPIVILKSTRDGWSPISGEETESVLPAAAFALAKIHMHLVYSGCFYTARGGICYTEQDIIHFHTDDGEDIEGLPTNGVEVTYFDLEGTTYLIYTPSKPIEFVVVKGENGLFQIAHEDLLDDYAVIDAIDEETEFNALVVEESAFIEEMLNDSENDSENEF